ncbi:uncharacterized protein LOC119676502 [Teleopsis dalmanni]|uniref:uncharacterized protein LOC119676502 n=1 Tax=Teleopsis dalmanni TaxID=139649 RepID=UPI0018CCAF4C|nr:uncharacterized protein LOC119676502 [Teleopsis dalmanni]
MSQSAFIILQKAIIGVSPMIHSELLMSKIDKHKYSKNLALRVMKSYPNVHFNYALHLSNLTVPRIIDASQRAKLFCSYEMGNCTLNSVKWYKDGQEFFRYSPLTPPTTNWFPVKGVTIADGSSHCNQFLCNVELEKLNVHSSGSYRCEVSGDAPEFKLIDKTANITVGSKFLTYASKFIFMDLHTRIYKHTYTVSESMSIWVCVPLL